jgi:hypothetical protein
MSLIQASSRLHGLRDASSSDEAVGHEQAGPIDRDAIGRSLASILDRYNPVERHSHVIPVHLTESWGDMGQAFCKVREHLGLIPNPEIK